MKMEKNRGFEALAKGTVVRGKDTEVIGYESPGKMILAQGSEVMHHVTPLISHHRRYVWSPTDFDENETF